MSEFVQLRDVELADLDLFFEYEQDPEAVRRSRFTPRDRDSFFAHWQGTILGDPTVLVQTVMVSGAPAGNLVSWWKSDRRFVGYWLGRKYWGRGVATEALKLFLALETTRPLWADPFAGNTGSVKLLEKHGFRRTGSDWDGEDEYIVLVLDQQN
jgi:RimJ/RimL family protein N-acetyltransferase